LAIIGCGGSSSKGGSTETSFVQNNKKATTLAGLKSLGTDSSSENLSNTKVRSTLDKFNSDDNQNIDQICQQGTMDVNTANNQQTMIFTADQCNDGFTTINGSAKVEIYDNEKGGFAKVLTDLTISDNYFSLLVKKDSWIKLQVNSQDNISLTAGFKTVINGETLAVDNLSIDASGGESGGSVLIKSGEIMIGDNYFKVVDGTTAIVTDTNSFVSGTIKLLDGANHKVEIAVVSKDEIALKVDENGDGTFSANEISTENLKDALDFIDIED
jgi:hypothetical protein